MNFRCCSRARNADKTRRQSKRQEGVSVRSVLGRGKCMTWPSQENRGDVCDVLHASRRGTYICTSEHMRRQPIMHTFRREQSLKIRHSLRVRSSTRFIRRRDRITVSRCIVISQLVECWFSFYKQVKNINFSRFRIQANTRRRAGFDRTVRIF